MTRAIESLRAFEPTMPSAEAARRLLLASAIIRCSDKTEQTDKPQPTEKGSKSNMPRKLDEASRSEAAELVAGVIDLPVGTDAKRTIESDIRSVAVLLAVRYPALGVTKAEPIAAALNANVAWAMPLAVARTAARMDELAPTADAEEFAKAAAPLLEVLDRADLGASRLFVAMLEMKRFAAPRPDDALPAFARVSRAVLLLDGSKTAARRVVALLQPLVEGENPPKLHPLLMPEALFASAVAHGLLASLNDQRHAMQMIRRLMSDRPLSAKATSSFGMIEALIHQAVQSASNWPGNPEARLVLDDVIDAIEAGRAAGKASAVPTDRRGLDYLLVRVLTSRPDRVTPDKLDELADAAGRISVEKFSRGDHSVVSSLVGLFSSALDQSVASGDSARARTMAIKVDASLRKYAAFKLHPDCVKTRLHAATVLATAGLGADASSITVQLLDDLENRGDWWYSPLDLQKAHLLMARVHVAANQLEKASTALQKLTTELDAIAQPTQEQIQLRMSAWAVLLDLWAKDPKKHADALLRIRTLRAADPALGGESTKSAIEAIEKKLTTP